MIVELPGLTRAGAAVRYEYPPWGIAFRSKFDLDPIANAAEVWLWNLSRDTIAELKRGREVYLWAGYEGDEIGLTFAGAIDTVETGFKGVDKITKLVLMSGKEPLARRPNRSWPAGTPIAEVVRGLFQAAGLNIGEIEVAGTYARPIAFAANTTVAEALDQVTRDAELKNGKPYRWFTDLGYGYFVPRDWAGLTGRRLIVSPERGLIDLPQPLNTVTEDVNMDVAEPRQWRVRIAFNWRVGSGWQVQVDSRRFKGVLKVVSGEHICTPVEKFETDLVCDEVGVTLVDYDYLAGDTRTEMPMPGLLGEGGDEG